MFLDFSNSRKNFAIYWGKIVESLIEKLSKNKLKYGIFSELLRECQKNCSIDKEKFLKTNGVKLRHCEKATKFEKISLLFWRLLKGQLISKRNSKAEDSPKKRTNEFVFGRILGQKKSFRDYLTFSLCPNFQKSKSPKIQVAWISESPSCFLKLLKAS